MSMPKVSIIIPSYNCAILAKNAVESALRRSYEGYEVIEGIALSR
jgi:glycosyltransferase involved in cell wall biosynthesis